MAAKGCRDRGGGVRARRLRAPWPLLLLLVLLLLTAGCTSSLLRAREKVEDVMTSTDVSMIKYHVEGYERSFEKFITRLYARNPKYEKDPAARARKLRHIFHTGPSPAPEYDRLLSHQLLTAAFAPETTGDRVYLLGLGLEKSIKEAYQLDNGSLLWTGLQVSLARLQALYLNISQVNWRLKTYRDGDGNLLFLTNGAAPDGTLNMGYEVIMTRVLTRIEDDIYLRGGLPAKCLFNMSTLFATVAL